MRYAVSEMFAAELARAEAEGRVEFAENLKIVRGGTPERPTVKIWRGKAKKPYANWYFANEEHREKSIAREIAAARESLAFKAELKAKREERGIKGKTIDEIFAALRAARGESGVVRLDAKLVAKLIRLRLAREFPGVKFSVRSDHNCVDIRWTNGPRGKVVSTITDEYRFGGFDGMIDLAYDSSNWLLPDGSMQHASTRGTTGSMGVVAASHTDAPHPRAIVVEGGPRYVFAHHEITDDVWERAARIALERFGGEYRDDIPVYNLRLPHGEHVTEWLHRDGGEILDAVLAET